MKKRDYTIDIIKLIAVLLVINSHMDIMYPKFKMLATGGAIGDVLFIFSSGYTLFMNNSDSGFFNWYKRRIYRIYPTVFAFSIITSLFFESNLSFYEVLLFGGGEFVSFIMVYYIIIYFIKKHFISNLTFVYVFFTILILLVYIFYFPNKYEVSSKGMYGVTTYFRWLPFFVFMVFGAQIGSKNSVIKFNFKIDLLKFFICLLAFYGVQLYSKHHVYFAPFQLISLIPLFGIVYYFYKILNDAFFEKIYHSKVGKFLFLGISNITLEIYIIQGLFFTDKMNNIFPLNLIFILVLIVVGGYLVKCLSSLIFQTFNSSPYSWKTIFSLYDR